MPVCLNHLLCGVGELEDQGLQGSLLCVVTMEVHRLTQTRQQTVGTFYRLITRTRTIPSLSGTLFFF